jgi:hypothetical protein
VVSVHGEEVSGEVTLLSYARTESGALLTVVARPGQLRPVGIRGRGSLMIPFRQFTATDDRGAGYQMSCHGNGSWPGEWTLRLYPDPPRDLSWLDLSTTPGAPAVRTTGRRNAISPRRSGYATAAAAGMPPASANITRVTSRCTYRWCRR